VAELEPHESNRHGPSMVEPSRPSLLGAKSHNLISTTFAKRMYSSCLQSDLPLIGKQSSAEYAGYKSVKALYARTVT
jgi:hypothetical protein